MLGIGTSRDELRKIGGRRYFHSRKVNFDTKKPEVLS